MEVVGWGFDPESGLKYWKARNSWGSYWGENGFFRIVRGINNMRFEEECVYALFDVSELQAVLEGKRRGGMFGIVDAPPAAVTQVTQPDDKEDKHEFKYKMSSNDTDEQQTHSQPTAAAVTQLHAREHDKHKHHRSDDASDASDDADSDSDSRALSPAKAARARQKAEGRYWKNLYRDGGPRSPYADEQQKQQPGEGQEWSNANINLNLNLNLDFKRGKPVLTSVSSEFKQKQREEKTRRISGSELDQQLATP